MILQYETVEPCGEKTRSETNWAVQSQKVARDLKFQIEKVEGLYYVAKKRL